MKRELVKKGISLALVIALSGSLCFATYGVAADILLALLLPPPPKMATVALVLVLSLGSFSSCFAALLASRELYHLQNHHEVSRRVGAYLAAAYRFPRFVGLAIVLAISLVNLLYLGPRVAYKNGFVELWSVHTVSAFLAARTLTTFWREVVFRLFGEAAPAKIGLWFPESVAWRVRRALWIPMLGWTIVLALVFRANLGVYTAAYVLPFVVCALGFGWWIGARLREDAQGALHAVMSLSASLRSRDSALGESTVSADGFIAEARFAMTREFLRWVSALSRSERSLARQQHRARSSLEKAQMVKTLFVAYMSHDLRSPLNSLVGFSDILLEGIDGPLSSAQRESVETIRESGVELLRLVTDIVDSAKVDAGKLQLQKEWISLAEVLRDAVSDAGSLSGEWINFDIDTPVSMPEVYVDKDRIVQALISIFIYIARVSQSGRHIRIRTTQQEHLVHVKIDSTGFRPNVDVGKLFEGMRAAKEPSGQRMKGLNLGLFLARAIVARHGGQLDYMVLAGGHGHFRISLPMGHRASLFEP